LLPPLMARPMERLMPWLSQEQSLPDSESQSPAGTALRWRKRRRWRSATLSRRRQVFSHLYRAELSPLVWRSPRHGL
jgi:hypothetical protein